MEETVESLEDERQSLYEKLQKVGDFRRGTLSAHYRKCGKQNCACTKTGHPGHGPQYLWSATIKGKGYARNLKLGPELRKYKEEIDRYHEFQGFCEEIVRVNESLCQLRPPPEVSDQNELEELKKKLQNLFKRKSRKKSGA